MSDLSFQYPYLLLLLLVIPIAIVLKRFVYKHTESSMLCSEAEQFSGARRSLRLRLRRLPDWLRYIAIAILILAISRPQIHFSKDEKSVEGIDIVFAIDVSTSMLAEDFKPNRLESAKEVTEQFINARKTDNMGIVVFAGEAYTKCPSTIDHNILLELLSSVASGEIDDGTAIGDGLATAINRVKDSKSKSKVIILVTDGVNNMGAIDPLTAASIAAEYGIRVYTIGIGKQGYAPYPYQTPFGKQYQNVEVKIDEDLLRQIAKTTGGKYYRSTKNSSLKVIFDEIDKMEKSRINVAYYKEYTDVGQRWVLVALALLVLELVLRKTYLRTNP